MVNFNELFVKFDQWARHIGCYCLWTISDVVQSFVLIEGYQLKPTKIIDKKIHFFFQRIFEWINHIEEKIFTVTNLERALSVRNKCSSFGFSLKNWSNAMVNSTAMSSNTWNLNNFHWFFFSSNFRQVLKWFLVWFVMCVILIFLSNKKWVNENDFEPNSCQFV